METLERFGALGDLHAEDRLLDAALAFLRERGVQQVLCVGDLVDGPGDAERAIQTLRRENVEVVRGNHDRWIVRGQLRDLPEATLRHGLSAESIAYLTALPPVRTYASSRGRVILCHGLGADDMASVAPDDPVGVTFDLRQLEAQGYAGIMVSGHSHRRMVRRFGKLTIVNVGTLLRHHGPSFALVDLPAGVVPFHDLGADGAVVGVSTVPLPE